MKQSKYNIEYFQNLARQKGGKCLSPEYINCRTKLEFQCSLLHIWKAEPRHIVEGQWCPVCGFQNGRKYSVDYEFFSRDTEECFYIAGFLAADGWKAHSNGGYTIGLMLAKKDLDHLLKIKELLKCNSPLRHRKRDEYICGNQNISHVESYSFVFNSKQCYKDLERFSVFQNKTYIIRFPEWLMKHPLVHHYMRGYIDGDGCFSISQNKGQEPHITFSMNGTKEFLEEFHNVLLRNDVCSQDIKRRKLQYRKGKKYLAFDVLKYSGNIIMSKMYDFLYKDATIYLSRKEEVAKLAKEYRVIGVKARKPRNNTLGFTKEKLTQELIDLGTQIEVAKKYNCTSAAINWWVKYLGISKKDYVNEDNATLYFTKEKLIQELIELGSGRAVARKYKCTPAAISWWKKRLGISKEEYQKATVVNNHVI